MDFTKEGNEWKIDLPNAVREAIATSCHSIERKGQ
jgi:hypothetical protein